MIDALPVASALDSPAMTIVLVILFSAIIVLLLTAVASGLLWLVLKLVDRYHPLH